MRLIAIIFTIVLWPVLSLADPPATQPPSRTEQELNSGSGVIVVNVLRRSQASILGIKPGDVIVKLNDQPVTSQKNFAELASSSSQKLRTLTLWTGTQERKITVAPGRIGIMTDEYGPGCGAALAAALRAYSEQDMPLARQKFEEAVKAGLMITPGRGLQDIRIILAYGNGDIPGAYKLLAEAADSIPGQDGYARLHNEFNNFLPIASHLYVYVSEQHLKAQPADVSVALDVASSMCDWGRQPEGIVRALTVLAQQPDAISSYGQAVGIDSIVEGYERMNLPRQALEAGQQLLKTDIPPDTIGRLANIAEYEGDLQLALKFEREAFRRVRQQPQAAAYHQAYMIRLLLMLGQDEEAQALVEELTTGQRDTVTYYAGPMNYAWPEAVSVMIDLAKATLREPGLTETTRDLCVQTLLLDPKADLNQAEALLNKKARDNRLNPRQDKGMDHAAYVRGQIALLKGDYATAAALFGATSDKMIHEIATYVEAVKFLQAHAGELEGERAIWKKTLQAYALPSGEWILVTKENQIGIASRDAKSIHKLPRPADRWWLQMGLKTLAVSSTGKTVLAVNGNELLRLKADRSGWEPIARMPLDTIWRLVEFPGALDDLAACLSAARGAPVKVLCAPSSRQKYSFVLPDGTWLYVNPKTQKLLLPRQAAEKALGEPVEIYALAPTDETHERVIVCSNKGVLLWRPAEAAVKPLPLPDTNSPKAVVPCLETGEANPNIYCVALRPAEGGTSYVVDLKTERITRQGCINEAYPRAYWYQKSARYKLDLINAAVSKAGLKWPWAQAEQPMD